MARRLSKGVWTRGAILAWLTAWMLAVPLVHVHPEADHHHGQPGHAHGGLTHTVVSADLPCEYGPDTDAHATSSAAPHAHGPAVGGTTHAGDHPEVAFSLLTSSSDRSSGKPYLAQVTALVAEDDYVHRASVCAAESPGEPLASVLRAADLSSRAPPLSAV